MILNGMLMITHMSTYVNDACKNEVLRGVLLYNVMRLKMDKCAIMSPGKWLYVLYVFSACVTWLCCD